MLKIPRTLLLRWTVRAALIVVLLYLYPYFTRVIHLKNFYLNLNQDGSFMTALFKSLAFATISSLAIGFFSLSIAFRLSAITPAGYKGKLLGLLMLPCLLGNVGTAFIWKLLLQDYPFFFKNPGTNFLAMLLVQFWQYGTLFIYLFWLNIHEVDKRVLHYGTTIRLTKKESFRDLYLPACRNLLLLLLGLQFIFSFYEETKLQYIFRSSRGTGAELISQWLHRTYNSDTLINSKYAFGHVTFASLVAVISIVLLLVVLILLANRLYQWYSGNRSVGGRKKMSPAKPVHPAAVSAGLFFFVLVILLPIIYATVRYYHYVPHPVMPLLNTFIHSLAAAGCATLFSVVFSIAARAGWPKILDHFNRRSLFFLILIFSLQLIPPIVLLASGYEWMKSISGTSQFYRSVIWVVGQMVLSFPLLASFSLFMHFNIENRDLNYLNSQRASVFEIARTLFWGPMKGRYLLTLLIAFSLIWNEDVLNSILSDTVPSFISHLQRVITGRMTDYAAGVEYLLVSVFLAASAVATWIYLTSKKNQFDGKFIVTGYPI